MNILTLHIGGMSCDACARSVEQALTACPGVSSAKADWAAGRAEAVFDRQQTHAGTLAAAVENAGFEVVRATMKPKKTEQA